MGAVSCVVFVVWFQERGRRRPKRGPPAGGRDKGHVTILIGTHRRLMGREGRGDERGMSMMRVDQQRWCRGKLREATKRQTETGQPVVRGMRSGPTLLPVQHTRAAATCRSATGHTRLCMHISTRRNTKQCMHVCRSSTCC